MYRLLLKSKLDSCDYENQQEQTDRLNARRFKPSLYQSILIYVIDHSLGGVHRTSSSEQFYLSKTLKRAIDIQE